MASSAATPPRFGRAGTETTDVTEAARRAAGMWWILLVTGLAWLIASLVILQFDAASITTIGVIVGIMFAGAGLQQFVLMAVMPRLRWLSAIFGVLFLGAAIVCFINPEETFAGLADILGFLFLTVGIWWVIGAFLERADNPIWWLGLLSGVLMIVLAFWTSGQFFLEKAYTLLVFAGIWALMHGITDVIRAFQIRSLRDEL